MHCRTNIEDGLERLSNVIPAGETYMHEGIKMVNKIIYPSGLPRIMAAYMFNSAK